MGRVVDGRVNGAPFAGIVLTAGSVLRADDAAGPVLSKKMEDTPIAGWYTIDGGQTPEDDIIEVKRERPPRLVLVDAVFCRLSNLARMASRSPSGNLAATLSANQDGSFR